jgi:hypothetical protein
VRLNVSGSVRSIEHSWGSRSQNLVQAGLGCTLSAETGMLDALGTGPDDSARRLWGRVVAT